MGSIPCWIQFHAYRPAIRRKTELNPEGLNDFFYKNIALIRLAFVESLGKI